MTPVGDGASGHAEAGSEEHVAFASVRGAATVFSDYFAVVGARFGAIVLSLVSVVMTTRILKPAGYGSVAYLSLMATLIFTVTSAWTSSAVSRYGREQLEITGDMVAVTWNRVAITAPLILVAVAIVAGLKVLGVLPPNFSWLYVYLAVVSGVLLVTSEHLLYAMEAAGRIKLSAAGLLIRQGAVVGTLLVMFFAATGRTIVNVVLISLLSSLVLTVAFAWAIWREAVWPPRFDRVLMRKIVKFSIPLIAFTFSQYVIRSVDLFVIGAQDATVDVGIYAVAYQAYSVMQGIAAATGPVLTPLFVSLELADKSRVIKRYVERVIPQLFFASSFLVGFGAPFATRLVPTVFGRGFAGARVPLAVLLCALVFFFVASLLASVMVLYEKTRAIAVINAGAAAINVVGDILLIVVFDIGVVGAAIATALAVAWVAYGYARIAGRSVGSVRATPPYLALPLLLGVATAITRPDLIGTGLGLAATAFVGVLILVRGELFAVEDIEMIERMDMSARPKAMLIRGLRLVTRNTADFTA